MTCLYTLRTANDERARWLKYLSEGERVTIIHPLNMEPPTLSVVVRITAARCFKVQDCDKLFDNEGREMGAVNRLASRTLHPAADEAPREEALDLLYNVDWASLDDRKLLQLLSILREV